MLGNPLGICPIEGSFIIPTLRKHVHSQQTSFCSLGEKLGVIFYCVLTFLPLLQTSSTGKTPDNVLFAYKRKGVSSTAHPTAKSQENNSRLSSKILFLSAVGLCGQVIQENKSLCGIEWPSHSGVHTGLLILHWAGHFFDKTFPIPIVLKYLPSESGTVAR